MLTYDQSSSWRPRTWKPKFFFSHKKVKKLSCDYCWLLRYWFHLGFSRVTCTSLTMTRVPERLRPSGEIFVIYWPCTRFEWIKGAQPLPHLLLQRWTSFPLPSSYGIVSSPLTQRTCQTGISISDNRHSCSYSTYFLWEWWITAQAEAMST